MSNDNETKLGRRKWISRGLIVLAAAPVLAACGSGGSELGCANVAGLDPQQQASRTGLHYVDAAADPTRSCFSCMLYTGTMSACGGCTLVAGPIDPNGSCDSFVART